MSVTSPSPDAASQKLSKMCLSCCLYSSALGRPLCWGFTYDSTLAWIDWRIEVTILRVYSAEQSRRGSDDGKEAHYGINRLLRCVCRWSDSPSRSCT